MAIERQLESESESLPETVSEAATVWLSQFVRQFKLNFIDASSKVQTEVSFLGWQRTTIEAVLKTIEESGLDREEALALFGEIASGASAEAIDWTPELNVRRFELIDKQIAGTLEVNERIELARLTRAMRRSVETEANLPIEGARKLHRELSQLAAEQRRIRSRPR